jgi:hypothetical protein
MLKKKLKRILIWMVIGALTGVVAATVVAPMVLGTLLAYTGADDAMCQCAELRNNTVSLLIQIQLWGAGGGAVLFPLIAVLSKWLWQRRKKAAGAEKTADTKKTADSEKDVDSEKDAPPKSGDSGRAD